MTSPKKFYGRADLDSMTNSREERMALRQSVVERKCANSEILEKDLENIQEVNSDGSSLMSSIACPGPRRVTKSRRGKRPGLTTTVPKLTGGPIRPRKGGKRGGKRGSRGGKNNYDIDNATCAHEDTQKAKRGGKRGGKIGSRGGKDNDNIDNATSTQNDVQNNDNIGAEEQKDGSEDDEDPDWLDVPEPPPIQHEFTGNPGLKIPAGKKIPKTPLEFFQLFIPREILKYIRDETNAYAKYCQETNRPKCKTKWKKCTLKDIAKYFGLKMLMVIVHCPKQDMHWATGKEYSNDAFNKAMTHKRFQLIQKYFHAFNKKAIPKNNKDRLLLVRPVMDFIRKRCHTVYEPDKNLSLDEGLLPFKGRLNFRVYNPKKPDKYGIKFYMLAESKNGYVLDFIPYAGTKKEIKDIVSELVKKYYHKGYRLFMDNFYNGVELTDELYDNKVHTCGTLRLSRVGIPKALTKLKNKKMTVNSLNFRRRGNTFIICWQDQRLVTMISNLLPGAATEKVVKRKRIRRKGGNTGLHTRELDAPVCIKHYNDFMAGVDLFDQKMRYYNICRRSAKWTVKFLLFILQLALQNAHILYSKFGEGEKKMSLLNFHIAIYRALLGFNESDWPENDDINIPHEPSLPENMRHSSPRKNPTSEDMRRQSPWKQPSAATSSVTTNAAIPPPIEHLLHQSPQKHSSAASFSLNIPAADPLSMESMLRRSPRKQSSAVLPSMVPSVSIRLSVEEGMACRTQQKNHSTSSSSVITPAAIPPSMEGLHHQSSQKHPSTASSLMTSPLSMEGMLRRSPRKHSSAVSSTVVTSASVPLHVEDGLPCRLQDNQTCVSSSSVSVPASFPPSIEGLLCKYPLNQPRAASSSMTTPVSMEGLLRRSPRKQHKTVSSTEVSSASIPLSSDESIPRRSPRKRLRDASSTDDVLLSDVLSDDDMHQDVEPTKKRPRRIDLPIRLVHSRKHFHYMEKIKCENGKVKQQECRVHQKRADLKRKDTTVQCGLCKMPLCPFDICWQDYHKKEFFY